MVQGVPPKQIHALCHRDNGFAFFLAALWCWRCNLFPPRVLVLLALGFLSVVAYSQNARINQYLDRVKRLRG